MRRYLFVCVTFLLGGTVVRGESPEEQEYFAQIDRRNAQLRSCGQTPEVRRTVVPVRTVRPDAAHALQTRCHQGIPSLAAAKNGRLWCTWYGGPTPGEDANNYAVLATSADGGETWKEVLVSDPDGPGPRRSFDPEIWLAPDGRLRWVWTDRLAPLYDPKGGANAGCHASPMQDQLWMCVLDAENEPSDPAPLPKLIGRGIMLGKPCLLPDGEQIWPVANWSERPSSSFYASRDGIDFAWRGGVTYLRDLCYDEHQVVCLDGGELHTWARLGVWRKPVNIGESVSKDGGRTWTVGKSGGIPHTSSRFFVTHLNSGNLLLVKHGSLDAITDARNDLTAYLSTDGGRSWKGGFLLDARNGVSYPDGQQLNDGRILIVYDYNRTTDRDILFAEFTEADVLAKKDVSGKVRLRRRISGRALAVALVGVL